MQILIPLAGESRRFAEVGYTFPKYLLPVDGKPMIARVLDDLPNMRSRVIFVVRPEHVEQHAAGEALRQMAPDCRLVVTEGATEGQADTVNQALSSGALDLDASVLMTAGDSGHLYNEARFYRATQGPYDCLVWTRTGDPAVAGDPTSYAWVRLAEDGISARKVVSKTPISEKPINDPVVTGAFWYRRAGDMVEAIAAQFEACDKTRGEYSMDTVPNHLMERGGKVGAFSVRHFVCWGEPPHVWLYEDWAAYFREARK
jgi:CTP:molybdopterin cytidylyltransferase MocA